MTGRGLLLVAALLAVAPSQAGAQGRCPSGGPCAKANVADEPVPFDIGPVRDLLRLYHDGKGHYVALVPLARCMKDEKLRDKAVEALFYGDGKVFYQQRVPGGGASCREGTADHAFWEPRVASLSQSQIVERGGKVTIRCGERTAELAPLSDEENRSRIANARFLGPRWRRRAYALARDEQGLYYFVDVLRGDKKRGFRLFVGPRGSLKQQRMKNVVSDSEGDIFATDKGELRLVLGRDEAAWIRGKKRTKLLYVPVERNSQFIYSELGPYVGEGLGTPCDDL